MFFLSQGFEHIVFYWITIQEIASPVRKNSLVCIIAPYNHVENIYRANWVRFFSDGMVDLARRTNLKIIYLTLLALLHKISTKGLVKKC